MSRALCEGISTVAYPGHPLYRVRLAKGLYNIKTAECFSTSTDFVIESQNTYFHFLCQNGLGNRFRDCEISEYLTLLLDVKIMEFSSIIRTKFLTQRESVFTFRIRLGKFG